MDNKKLMNLYIDKCYELVRVYERLARLSRQESGWASPGVIDLLDINDAPVNKTLQEILQNKARVEKELDEIIRRAKTQGLTLPFEEIAQKFDLSPLEKLMIMVVFYCGTLNSRDEAVDCEQIFDVLATKPSENLELRRIIHRLLETGLLEASDDFDLFSIRARRTEFLSNPKVRLGPKVLKILKPALDMDFVVPRSSKKIFKELKMKPKPEKILNIREPQLSSDQIVHPEERAQALNRILFDIQQGNEKLLEWGFDQTIKYGKGVVVLFYGPPGTGKTATAEAIAYELKKKLGVVSYAQLLNCYVGESEKNLMRVFKEAREEDCILLFDEADSLFAQRLTELRSVDRMHNYMTNILMQELERYDGVVILTTNREYAFDEAFPRRILYKIKFDLPGPAERARIWRVLIPSKAPLAPDVDFEVLGEKYPLTGGEIKNALLKAVKECIYLRCEFITMEVLSKYAQAELENVGQKTKRRVGFKPE